jgi:hypothetical protein
VQDYLDLEALMFRVNAQAVRGTFDTGGESRVSRTFRRAVCAMDVDSKWSHEQPNHTQKPQAVHCPL